MLKAKSIKYDLHHLTGSKIFGVYPSRNQKNTLNLDMSAYPIIEALSPFEIDFRKLYKVSFEDVFYNDAQGNYESLELLGDKHNTGNSYNWNSAVVFHWQDIKIIDNYGIDHEYRAIQFHRFGDVRGNYTDFMVLDININDDYDFWETITESSRVYCTVTINNIDFNISTDCTKESCVFDVYCNDLNIDDYDQYLDIYNTRSKKDILKAIKQEYKEQIKAK